MSVAEYACVFVRPPRERLAAAERLVRALPSYLGAGAGECDLHRCAASGYLAAVVRAPEAAFSPDAVARLGFWTARTGARGFLVGALSEADRSRFGAELALCERVVKRTPLAQLADLARRFFGDLGVPPPRDPAAQPALAVDLDGPGGHGVHYRPESRALFVAGLLAPPRGDQLTVAVRDRKAPAPVEGWATVVEVRPRERATAGSPAGFTLRIEGPSALHELLARRAREQPDPLGDARAAPRFPVKAPVKVTPTAPAAGGGAAPIGAAKPAAARSPAARRPPPRARVAYASEQELAADWIENLSHGGAFVRTPGPLPEGTEVVLELALPDGARLEARGAVAFVNTKGMGIRFVLSPEQDEVLSAAIARISARPRRALVVDDDALIRMVLTDALGARGFEVITADDGESGLRMLTEELLALDLLLTDACMPGIDGETFIRTIRQAGGEAELAIVAVTGVTEPGFERKLEAAGADAVLEKSLGPELIAQAADAVLERKRVAQQGAADAA
ncbi:MAG TPA: response regulator [Anaeromyxobacter sp.]|nr:response regulator [Anaeromyxobacter sp.]